MARKKKRIATIDAETDPFKYLRKPEPFCWGFYDGETYIDFWGDNCTQQLMEYLEDEEDLIIYAHNGGKFDFFYLIPWLDSDLFIINGRIAKATLFDGRIEIRDSWLIIPLPLSAYQKDEISYDLFEKHSRNLHKTEILRYLRGDCRYLWDWVTNFIAQFGNGLTLAGTSFKELKKTGYDIPTTFEEYDASFRPYYFGGRVQCFDVGSFYGDFKYVDINSAYPFAMKERHWHGSQYMQSKVLPEQENGSWFAHVRARSHGALPWRDEADPNQKLYFPDDGKSRDYFATGWEIKTGLETGTLTIDKVHTVFKPVFTADFSEYVEKFFAMKAKADADLKKNPNDKDAEARRQFAKLMLNACYGKFGQDGRDFEKFSLQPFGGWPEGEGWMPYETVMEDLMMFSKPDPIDRFFNVPTAASVTGYVRAYLWEAINQSERPLYCDTDSIICADFHGDIGNKLGQWDVEARAIEVHIGQRKMYAMRELPVSEYGPIDKTKVASKGVQLDFDTIKNGIANRSIIVTERDAPAFSLKYGARFLPRTTDFKNIEKNVLTVPSEAA